MLAAVRAENRRRYKTARTLWMIGAGGLDTDILTRMFVAEAKERALARLVHELVAKKGLPDPIVALECALLLYREECVLGDPRKEFGEYATIHYP